MLNIVGSAIDCSNRGHRKAWDAAGPTDRNSRGTQIGSGKLVHCGNNGALSIPYIFNLAFSLGLTLTISGILMVCLNSLV